MNRIGLFACAASVWTAVAGCGSLPVPPLAPGAEKVKITRNPSDVAGCKAVGNVHVEGGNLTDAPQILTKNRAIGLGGDTVFNTSLQLSETMGGVIDGVVYRCAKDVSVRSD